MGKAHTSQEALGERIRGQLIMLTAQFVLGMAVNLIGLPSETTGTSKTVTSAFLGLHVFIAIGLLIGAGLTVWRATVVDRMSKQWALVAAGLVVITITAGVLTMLLNNAWWSYIMAIGFLASFVVYGTLYIRTKR